MSKYTIQHYKVLKLPTKPEPNSVYYILDSSLNVVRGYITDLNGIPIKFIDLSGNVNSVTGTGVTGTLANPKVDIATFVSTQLGNLISLSIDDEKLVVKPITSPDGSLEVTETVSELQIELSSAILSQINTALQPGDNISELVNDVGYLVSVDFSNIVYVNSTNPTTATIFDLNNPPTVNNDSLKEDVSNLYIGTDGSTWTYKTSPAGYNTYNVASGSNFYLSGGTIDAGSNKTNPIKRNGSIEAPALIVTNETINTIASFDSSKNIKSLSTATYPSLTELTYLKNVSSPIQAQINSKEDVSNKTNVVIGNENSTSLYLNILGAVTYFQQKLTDIIFGNFITSLSTKTTILDVDTSVVSDSADSNKAKKVSWLNIFNYIKSKSETEISYACSDELSDLMVGTLITFRMPFGMTLTTLKLSLNSAPTGSKIIVDIRKGGITILSTFISVDTGSTTSVGASVPYVISDSNLIDDSIITITTTQVGSASTGKGLKVTFLGKRI